MQFPLKLLTKKKHNFFCSFDNILSLHYISIYKKRCFKFDFKFDMAPYYLLPYICEDTESRVSVFCHTVWTRFIL